MKKLRARGIHLAMDDFGTGYSSLAYLKQFPLNTLKIDKAFIDDMNTARGRNMVDTIMTIAHNLSLSVVAEGVEQEEQLAMLRKLRCDVIQGYYYSKPLSDSEFTQFLQEQKARRIKLSAVPV
jgi:EAL domain-containing protein (putative c-di-GMP-specific phosphodiesterase class I)